MIAARRIFRRTWLTSPANRPCNFCDRSKSGMTRSLHTIVDTATHDTITMPVLAESPPTKANTASQFSPPSNGSVRTNVSGLTAGSPPNSRIPAIAIGTTKILIAIR